MKKKTAVTVHSPGDVGSGLDSLANSIVQLVKEARASVAKHVNNMHMFYLTYPICQNVSDKLPWRRCNRGRDMV